MLLKRRRGQFLTIAAASVLMVAACGGGTVAPAASAPPAGGSAKAFQGTKNFTFTLNSIGQSTIPLLAALDALRGQGFKIETPEVAEAEIAVQGVAEGKFDFASGATSAVFLAVQKGSRMKILVDRVSNEWTMYSVKGITSCAGLDGKRLAIHSDGAVSTAMVRNYLKSECPSAKPTFLTIPGSDNRLKALLAGQIDASPLELSDAIAIETSATGRFNLLTSFAKTLPNLHPTAMYGNGDFVAKNPDTVKALIKAVLEQHRKIAGNSKYLAEITLKYLPKFDKKTIDLSTKTYTDLKMFDVNGGLTEENLKGTLDFFTAAGTVKPGLTLAETADFSYLQAVLAEIGRK